MTGEYPPHYATRACVACKEKKLRCLMNAGPPWVCQRCQQKQLNCTIPESRPRQRKKKAHEYRIEQLERHVENVMSLLPNSQQTSIVSSCTAPETSPQSLNTLATIPGRPLPDVISQGIISSQQAEIFVADYTEHFARNFPYVILPPGACLSNLRQENPIFLLAILVTTSWKERAVQDALNEAFLKALSAKLIMQSERDLDLLKGLMVYLNWIHLHMAPTRQQAYQLMCIAASMAVNYGITQRPRKGRHQQLNIESICESPKGLTASDNEFWDPAARRAYLGCYHIATWFSIMTRKSSPLSYSDYLHACARSLAEVKSVPSDQDLMFYLEMAHEAEKVYTMFNYTETAEPQYLSDEQMQIYLNAFSVKAQEWRSRLNSSFKLDYCQQVWPWLFEAFVREVGLSGLSRSPRLSTFRIRTIIESLKSTKNYFDTFLAIPSNLLASLPSTHWSLLAYSIMLATTMSLSIQTPEWNIQAARSIVKLDTYLDAISVPVRSLASEMSPSLGLKNWYGGLITSWETIKSQYLAALQRQEQSEIQIPGSHCHVQLPSPHEVAPQIDHVHHQSCSSSEPWIDDSRQYMAEKSLRLNDGYELLDFATNAGLWMVPDLDFT